MAREDGLELPLTFASRVEGLRPPPGSAPPPSANDNRRLASVPREPPSHDPSPARLASAIPADAIAVIEPRTRSATQSGKWGRRGWRLRFLPRRPAFVDPFTGWTGGEDTLSQIELSFATREEAERYAERHGLAYEMRGADLAKPRRAVQQKSETPLWPCCWPTGPHALCCGRYPILQANSGAASTDRTLRLKEERIDHDA